MSIYGAYTSVNHGWVRRPAGWSISAVFLVVWIYVSSRGGWFMNTTEVQRAGSWSFPVYFAAMTAALLAFVLALRVVSTPAGRRHLDAGVWLIATLLATLLVSYYGEFGPLDEPPLADYWDLLVVITLALVSYVWAVRSGFHTEQLDAALADSGLAVEPAAPTRTPAHRATPVAAVHGQEVNS